MPVNAEIKWGVSRGPNYLLLLLVSAFDTVSWYIAYTENHLEADLLELLILLSILSPSHSTSFQLTTVQCPYLLYLLSVFPPTRMEVPGGTDFHLFGSLRNVQHPEQSMWHILVINKYLLK